MIAFHRFFQVSVFSMLLSFVVVSGACSTVRPRPLAPLPKDSTDELRGAYKGTQQAYEACAQQDVDAQVPWQLYAAAISGGVGVISVASAAGLMFVPGLDDPTRAGIAGGLGALALLSGGLGAVFTAHTLQRWSREDAYKAALEAAAKRSNDAVAAGDSRALMDLTRALNEDCRVVQNSTGHDAATQTISDLNRWRKGSTRAEYERMVVEKKLSEIRTQLDACAMRRDQLLKNIDKLQNDF